MPRFAPPTHPAPRQRWLASTGIVACAAACVVALAPTAHARVQQSTSTSTPTPPPSPAATCTAPAAAVADKVRVMVLDLRAPPARAELAAALSQVVAAEAGQVPGFQLLSMRDVQAAVAQEAQRQVLGCDDDGCLAELADAADAELLIHGTLGALDDGAPLVTLALLNTRALVVVNRVAFGWPGDPAALPAVVAAATQTLVLEPRGRPPGAVRVVGLPAEAQVFVDGADRTAEHRRGEVTGLAVGPHAVRVVADGMLPAVTHVVVRRGETAVVQPVLEPEPLPALWLWAGGAAVAAAGVGVTVGVVWALARADVRAEANVPSWTIDDAETLRGTR